MAGASLDALQVDCLATIREAIASEVCQALADRGLALVTASGDVQGQREVTVLRFVVPERILLTDLGSIQLLNSPATVVLRDEQADYYFPLPPGEFAVFEYANPRFPDNLYSLLDEASKPCRKCRRR